MKQFRLNNWLLLTYTTIVVLSIGMMSCSKDEELIDDGSKLVDSVFDSNIYYIITALHNGKVLDVGCEDVHDPSKPNSDRDNVCVFNKHDGQNQLWKIELLDDGSYRLTAMHNGKVLDVGCEDVHDPSKPNSDRDNVCAFDWHGGANQRWKIELLDDGSYRLTAMHNGKVLDVGCEDVHDPSKPNSDRDNVCAFNWHGGANQRWNISKVNLQTWSNGQ